MACDNPLRVFRGDRDPLTRRVPVYFQDVDADAASGAVYPLSLPCGKCDGCRLDNARQLALRAMHEASLHESNCFLTLTYSDDNLPAGGSLCPRHLDLFWKKLRVTLKRTGLHSGRLRYLACGEYGDHTFRPHYHAIVFGFYPPDTQIWSSGPSGTLYISEALNRVWGHGNVVIGAVTPQTVSYVARYALKKAGGSKVPNDHPTLFREFRRVSRRPGLGRGWAAKFACDIRKDTLYLDRGIIAPVPRYYLNLLETEDLESFVAIKNARSERAAEKSFEDPHGVHLPAAIANRNARLNLSRGKL